MGNKHSKKLSPELESYAIEIFKQLDTDGSNAIDKVETINHWQQNFAKLNTKEMFADLDKNGDNVVELDEWLSFWRKVKHSGYSEEEIREELTNIKEGKSWARFNIKNQFIQNFDTLFSISL